MPKYKLTDISVTDFQRIEDIRVELADTLTIVGGGNGEGKSSLMNAIAYMLAGKKSIPTVKMPVRKGAEKALLEGTIEGPNGNMFIKVTVKEDGTEKFEFKNEDGMKAPGRGALAQFFNPMAVDPLAFLGLDDKKQVEQVKKFAGIDSTELDTEFKSKYEERRDVNRTRDSISSRANTMPKPPADTPDEEVSTAEAVQDLTEAKSFNANLDQAAANALRSEAQLRDIHKLVEGWQGDLERHESEVARLKKAIEREKPEIEKIEGALNTLKADIAAAEKIDTAPLLERVNNADAINRNVRLKRDRAALKVDWTEANAESEALTARLTEIAEEKKALIANAKLPVDGLTFDEENGLFLDGIPFAQVSTSQQIRVAVPLALATAGKLPIVFVKDGSLLDDDSMKLLAEIVAEHGAQCFIEVVGEREDATFIIEAGASRPPKKGTDAGGLGL